MQWKVLLPSFSREGRFSSRMNTAPLESFVDYASTNSECRNRITAEIQEENEEVLNARCDGQGFFFKPECNEIVIESPVIGGLDAIKITPKKHWPRFRDDYFGEGNFFSLTGLLHVGIHNGEDVLYLGFNSYCTEDGNWRINYNNITMDTAVDTFFYRYANDGGITLRCNTGDPSISIYIEEEDEEEDGQKKVTETLYDFISPHTMTMNTEGSPYDVGVEWYMQELVEKPWHWFIHCGNVPLHGPYFNSYREHQIHGYFNAVIKRIPVSIPSLQSLAITKGNEQLYPNFSPCILNDHQKNIIETASRRNPSHMPEWETRHPDEAKYSTYFASYMGKLCHIPTPQDKRCVDEENGYFIFNDGKWWFILRDRYRARSKDTK